MASHLHSLGFAIDTPEEFGRLAEAAAAGGRPYASGRRAGYIRYRTGEGAELWVQLTGNGLIGMNPHFDGETRLALRVVAGFTRRGESPLDGAWRCELDPGTGERIPVILDAPDFALQPKLRRPQEVAAQVVGFAYRLHAFPDAQAFAAAQEDMETRYAPESLITVGALTDRADEQTADALVAGCVVATGVRINELTDVGYRWCRVRTVGGAELDLVAAPADIEGRVEEGGVVIAEVWLSGRIAPDDG